LFTPVDECGCEDLEAAYAEMVTGDDVELPPSAGVGELISSNTTTTTTMRESVRAI